MELINLDVLTRDTGSDATLHHIRKEGFIPGVVYGAANYNLPIQVNRKAFMKQLKRNGRGGLFQVVAGNEQILVKINEIQKNPVTQEIIHVDLQKVDQKKIVYMTVPINFFGQAKGVSNGGMLQQQLREIEVKALPSDIPSSIHVNISDLKIGESLYVRDLSVPDEVDVLSDQDSVILTILTPRAVEEESTEEPTSEPEVVNARDGHGIDAAK